MKTAFEIPGKGNPNDLLASQTNPVSSAAPVMSDSDNVNLTELPPVQGEFTPSSGDPFPDIDLFPEDNNALLTTPPGRPYGVDPNAGTSFLNGLFDVPAYPKNNTTFNSIGSGEEFPGTSSTADDSTTTKSAISSAEPEEKKQEIKGAAILKRRVESITGTLNSKDGDDHLSTARKMLGEEEGQENFEAKLTAILDSTQLEPRKKSELLTRLDSLVKNVTQLAVLANASPINHSKYRKQWNKVNHDLNRLNALLLSNSEEMLIRNDADRVMDSHVHSTAILGAVVGIVLAVLAIQLLVPVTFSVALIIGIGALAVLTGVIVGVGVGLITGGISVASKKTAMVNSIISEATLQATKEDSAITPSLESNLRNIPVAVGKYHPSLFLAKSKADKASASAPAPDPSTSGLVL